MIKRNIFKYKSYSYFDNKKCHKHFLGLIKNPKKIEKHGFYPFIHYVIKQHKYDNDNNETKTKERDINYSSHIDRYIYEYYNDLLNSKYNDYASKNGINKCVVAYRNNLYQNNIHIARNIFNFIKKGSDYYILVADFTKYFDKIDHKFLKSTLSLVLGYEKLPLDWYKVYRSVTKFSNIDLDKIAEYKDSTVKRVRKTKRIASIEELHELKKYLQINNKGFGIPQGSSISSSLANVNLIHYDKGLNNFITFKEGIYRRYCDDIVIVIPIGFKDELLENFERLNKTVPGLEIHCDKRQEYYYKDGIIVDKNNQYTTLRYLGFEFDGKCIKVREKTITSFFLKAYRSLKFVNAVSKKYKRNAYRKKIYTSFTHLGKQKSKRNRENFLTYIDRCVKIMSDNGKKKQVSKHWVRFNKRLLKTK